MILLIRESLYAIDGLTELRAAVSPVQLITPRAPIAHSDTSSTKGMLTDLGIMNFT